MESKRNEKLAKQLKTSVSKDFINEKCLIFGENVRLARKERGFTAEVLARFLEISTAYVGLIERGERCPSLETFIRICDFFGESYEDMLNNGNVLSLAENKLLARSESTKDLIARRQKMLLSMINTFEVEELDYIIGILKGFKNYNRVKKEGFVDADFDIDNEVVADEA